MDRSKVRHSSTGTPSSVSIQLRQPPLMTLPSQVDSNAVKKMVTQLGFKMRICEAFIPKESDDRFCCCGYEKTEHKKNTPTKEKPWDAEQHTKLEPTNAYGDINFVGFGNRTAKYIRLEYKTNTAKVIKLLTEVWDLNHPKLIISVTGGAKNFHMKPRLKEVFRRGLMKAAESTDAWIITGGMHAGVMKHVGEAVRNHLDAHGVKTKVAALAIAPWSAVNNKGQLEHSRNGMLPARYKANPQDTKLCSPLDPNHTHYILVDDGTQRCFGGEIEFRAQLETEISNLTSSKKVDRGSLGSEAEKIPSVCVVLEGGPGTLKTVYNAMKEGTPAVIVEGSGRAADIIAYGYAKYTEDSNSLSAELQKELKDKLSKEFGEKKLEENLDMLKSCLENHHYITVFRLDGGQYSANDIDVAMLQALLKTNEEKVKQLQLALIWNRIDVAKNDIFTENREIKWTEEDKNLVMFQAIILNKVEFVELFLENGINLADFVTKDTVLQLYRKLPDRQLFWKVFRKATKNKTDNEEISLQDIGKYIQGLVGDFYKPLYLTKEFQENTSTYTNNGFVRAETVPNLLDITVFTVVKGDTTEIDTSQFKNPGRELYLWCILNNQKELAVTFWNDLEEGTAAALLAQKLLQTMASKANLSAEWEQELSDNAEYFGTLAVEMLHQCYLGDEDNTKLLLTKENNSFGCATCLELAVAADNKKFLAHFACQDLLTSIWRGKIADTQTWYHVIPAILLLPVFPCMIKFKQEEQISSGIPALHNKVTKESQETDKDTEFLSDDDESAKKACCLCCKTYYSYFNTLKYFYNSPKVIYTCNLVSFLVFLFLFGIPLLTDFDKSPSVAEWIVVGWVITLLLEEIRQWLTAEGSTLRKRFVYYITDPWNTLDTVTMTLFILGMILKWASDSDSDTFIAARVILAVNLMTFVFRILHLFSINKRLGPLLVMIGEMMKDLLYFATILLVFVVAYGVCAQAILYPNATLNISLVSSILKLPYYQMFGEMFLDDIEGETCSGDETCPSKEGQWLVPIILGIYVMVTNILMLNLLIAMFSNTYSKIQDNAGLHWSFQRFFIVKEYYERPPLAPPLIIISHVFLLIRKFCTCCGGQEDHQNSFHIKIHDVTQANQLIIWENMQADEYLYNSRLQKKLVVENQVAAIHQKVDFIAQHIESSLGDESLESSSLTLSTDHRLRKMEHQIQEVYRLLKQKF